MNHTLTERPRFQQVTQVTAPFQVISPTTGLVIFEVAETEGGGIVRIFDKAGQLAADFGCTGISPEHRELVLFRDGEAVTTIEADAEQSAVRVSSGAGDGPIVGVFADPYRAAVEIAEHSERFRLLTAT